MDYSLLDSGEGKKLERFGSVTLIRPSPVAIWPKQSPQLWSSSLAEYRRSGEKGRWILRASVPEEWTISLRGVHCVLKLTPFGHVGVFPEHSGFWSSLEPILSKKPSCRVLNLFAYTGATSFFCAKQGATVWHVDASKAAIKWAQKNAEKNTLPDKRVFWVIEDAYAFLKREIRRGRKFDAILLDPPTYGRGPNGEVFKIDEGLFPLLQLCSELLAPDFSYLLLTSHTPGHTPEFLRGLAHRALPNLSYKLWSCGESFCGSGDEALPSGVFVQWSV